MKQERDEKDHAGLYVGGYDPAGALSRSFLDENFATNLPDFSGTFSGTFDAVSNWPTLPAGPQPVRIVLPKRLGWRGWWRWEVVEYSGNAVLAFTDDGDLQGDMRGALDRIVHPRRFWLLRSAKRYMQRLAPKITD